MPIFVFVFVLAKIQMSFSALVSFLVENVKAGFSWFLVMTEDIHSNLTEQERSKADKSQRHR